MNDESSEVARYRQRVVDAGLAKYADALVALARPSVRLTPASTADDLPVGASRLGGHAELAAGAPWPMLDGRPLSFIAQLNLDDFVSQGATPLPSRGVLSFFYDAVEQSAWGFDPGDRDAWTVVHTSEPQDLVRREFPDDLAAEGRFKPLRLTGKPEWTFAPWESSDVDRLGLSRDEGFALAALGSDDDATSHRLPGHPDPIQGDMQLECQLAGRGLYCGDSTGYKDPRRLDLEPGATSWRLLLQVDTQDEIDMMWGEVWMILQCG